MSIISGGGAVAGSSVAYQIERSLRFNSADTAYLNRTGGTSTNRRIHTFSFWTKSPHVVSGATRAIASAGSDDNNREVMLIYQTGDSNVFDYQVKISSTFYEVVTTQVFRDPSAWYHFVVAVDTTQATGSNRVKIYLNGTQITAFSSASYPPQNSDLFFDDSNGGTSYIGAFRGYVSSTYAYNGYITEFNFIDGQALTPSSFGEADSATGVWGPKAYSGTYGTNGFYLKFADNSGTTAATLGKDSSGNSNNWTPNNFSVTAGIDNDSLVDSPTSYGTDTGVGGEVRGNYATFNAVKYVTNSITYSNGNLQSKPGSDWSTTTYVEGTIGVLGGSTGKYYWELSANQDGQYYTAGVALQNNTVSNNNIGTTGSVMIYDHAKYVNGTVTGSFLTRLDVNEVMGVALDASNGKVWFRDSGGWLGSGDPAAGTNEVGIITGFSGGTLVPVTQGNSLATVTVNFGQRAFSYTAPSGFKALCTQNLPTPTIGATSTTQAGKYFNAVLYTGNNSTKSITGVGFQPDFLWIKMRSLARSHALFDAVRGVGYNVRSNTTDVEEIPSPNDSLTAFNSDGFTLGPNNNSGCPDINYTVGGTYVAWNWKANGAGVSNNSGSIPSTVSASTTAGFSIVTYTANNGTAATVGHGLGAVPKLILFKNKSNTGGYHWVVYHGSLAITSALYLSSQAAEQTPYDWWNNTAPTPTVFSIKHGYVNNSTDTYVAYCFAEIPGYSKISSYTGNGSSDGPFVFTGFRPNFILIRRPVANTEWEIRDSVRLGYNPETPMLFAEQSVATYANDPYYKMDLLANGFKLRNTNSASNASGATCLYAAFAETPFKYALAR